EVEDVVQVDVGQQRTDAAALHGADLAHGVVPVVQHASGQPFLDQSDDAPVRHAVLDEPNQPSVVQRIEGTYDTLPVISTPRRSRLSVPVIPSKANRSTCSGPCTGKVGSCLF